MTTSRALTCLSLMLSLACFEDPSDVDDETGSTTQGTGISTNANTTLSIPESGGETTSNGSTSSSTSAAGTESATSGSTTSATATTGNATTTTGTSMDSGSDTSTSPQEETSDADETSLAEATESTGMEVLPGRCDECESGFCTLDGDCAWAVFVTSELFTAGFGGLTGGDMWCNTLAESAGLPGRYMAWLSSPTLGAVTRLIGHSDPYVLVNGTRVAENFSVFVTHQYGNIDAIYLEHAIDRDENGSTPPRGTACQAFPSALPVFTGTLTNGSWDTYGNCEEWTDGEGEDDLYPGSARAVDSFWTISACSETDCSRTASLYCFQTEAD